VLFRSLGIERMLDMIFGEKTEAKAKKAAS
jgi:hypothetical protein